MGTKTADTDNVSKITDVDPTVSMITFSVHLGNTVRSPGAGLQERRKTLQR